MQQATYQIPKNNGAKQFALLQSFCARYGQLIHEGPTATVVSRLNALSELKCFLEGMQAPTDLVDQLVSSAASALAIEQQAGKAPSMPVKYPPFVQALHAPISYRRAS